MKNYMIYLYLKGGQGFNFRERRLDNLYDVDLPALMVAFRAKHNLTQAELARMCQVTVVTINSIEGGRTDGSKLTRAKILRIVREGER